MTLVVFTSASEIVCTSDRFARREDGKAVGFECVTTVLDEVSEESRSAWQHGYTAQCSESAPLQDAPQTAQVKTAFCLPALPSSRLPQSVQKTREPIADMAEGLWLRIVVLMQVRCLEREKK
jgi:hypothetical protein